MTVRVDTTSLIAGAVVCGHRGLGVLGSQIPGTGDQGPAYAYPSLSLPADANKEIRGLIVTPPASGTFVAYEDTSFVLSGVPDGTYSFVFRLFVDGVDFGTATASINVGPIQLAGDALVQAAASAGLQLLKSLSGAASGAASASGALAHGAPLAGAGAGQAAAGAAASLVVRLAGSSVGQAGGAGVLSNSSGISGGATAIAGAGGQLALSVVLFGDALAAAQGDATLNGIVALDGAAAVAAGAAGSLMLSVPIAGAAQQIATAGGGVVLTVLLGASAAGRALAGAAFAEDVLLTGAAGASATVAGTLAGLGPDVHPDPAWRVRMPQRSWVVRTRFTGRKPRTLQ